MQGNRGTPLRSSKAEPYILIWSLNFNFSAHGCRHTRPRHWHWNLRREVGPDHALFGKPAKALAVSEDRDDVLFEIAEGGITRYAVVHLTWIRKTESSGKWPRTEFFDSLDDWLAWMKADHKDYTWGEGK
jgi:hypothetical protein